MKEELVNLINDEIQERIANLDTVTDAEEYYNSVKAIRELSEIPVSDYKAQTDAYAREEDIRLRERELDIREEENKKQKELDERKDKKDLIKFFGMIATVFSISGLTILEEHNGWIFKQDGIVSKLTGLIIKS